jgi:predicted transcriptional regulator
MQKKTLPLSMRLDPQLKEALQRLADRDRRTLTNFIEAKLWEIVEAEDVVVSLAKRRK